MAEVARLFPRASGGIDARGSDAAGSEETDFANPTQALFGEAMRIAEALLFAATEPLEETEIARRMPDGVAASEVLARLKADYAPRGVNLVRIGKKWLFRTAGDLGWLLSRDQTEPRKLSRAALETLAIVAYHQPVTRAEIEDIRGVAISKGTMDVLIETGWVRLRGRRRSPGRPVTYGTTEAFLLHFGLEAIGDLPGLEELKGAGLFDGRLPSGFEVPLPSDDPALAEDEDPLDEGPQEFLLADEEADADDGQGEGDMPGQAEMPHEADIQDAAEDMSAAPPQDPDDDDDF